MLARKRMWAVVPTDINPVAQSARAQSLLQEPGRPAMKELGRGIELASRWVLRLTDREGHGFRGRGKLKFEQVREGHEFIRAVKSSTMNPRFSA
jgi:hypothetical protein